MGPEKVIVKFTPQRTTAILVDGGFYRRIAQRIYGDKTPQERAHELEDYCRKHIMGSHENRDLYRIFYYDCPPSGKQVYHPLLGKTIDLGKTEISIWMRDFLSELKAKRKFALRLGELSEDKLEYGLKYNSLKKLHSGSLSLSDLTEDDYTLNIVQKGVDMKIGVDIASLAYKKQVDQIILISGDSDFVPAAKLARREGIDFILDSMRQSIKDNLFEHIDGMQTHISNSAKKTTSARPAIEEIVSPPAFEEVLV